MRKPVIWFAALLSGCSGEMGAQEAAVVADEKASETPSTPERAAAMESPLLTYNVAGQTAFMQALGGGVLTLERGCVYMANAAGRTLLVLPDPPTRWNAGKGTIQFGERELRFGDEVAFGGGEGGSIAPGPVADAARRKGCDTSRVWWASPELVTPRALPQAMPPPSAPGKL